MVGSYRKPAIDDCLAMKVVVAAVVDVPPTIVEVVEFVVGGFVVVVVIVVVVVDGLTDALRCVAAVGFVAAAAIVVVAVVVETAVVVRGRLMGGPRAAAVTPPTLSRTFNSGSLRKFIFKKNPSNQS